MITVKSAQLNQKRTVAMHDRIYIFSVEIVRIKLGQWSKHDFAVILILLTYSLLTNLTTIQWGAIYLP